jgi:hypothetical protein
VPALFLPLLLATMLAPAQLEPPPATPPASGDAPVAPEDGEPAGEPTTSQPGESSADTPGATDPSVVTADPNGCPCGPTDWACMQENPIACDWATRRPPPPTDDARATEPPRVETGPNQPPEKKRMEPRRTGLLVAVGGGYLGCRTAYCYEVFSGAFAMEAELGYRWRFIAPVIIVAGGRGSMDLPPGFSDFKGRLGFVDVGAGAVVFPAPRTIFDPYLGVTLGMARSRINVRDRVGAGVSVDETVTRGAVRFVAGLNFFVSPRVSLGPRFAIYVPFAGKWCLIGEPDPANANRCREVQDLREEEALDPRDLPRSFAFTLHVRLILPPHGSGARPREHSG